MGPFSVSQFVTAGRSNPRNILLSVVVVYTFE